MRFRSSRASTSTRSGLVRRRARTSSSPRPDHPRARRGAAAPRLRAGACVDGVRARRRARRPPATDRRASRRRVDADCVRVDARGGLRRLPRRVVPGSVEPLVGLPGWHCFLAWSATSPPAAAPSIVDGDARLARHRRRRARRSGAAARRSRFSLARIEAARVAGADAAYDRDRGAPSPRAPRPVVPATSCAPGFRESYLRPNWRSA